MKNKYTKADIFYITGCLEKVSESMLQGVFKPSDLEPALGYFLKVYKDAQQKNKVVNKPTTNKQSEQFCACGDIADINLCTKCLSEAIISAAQNNSHL
jgi:hypothetical protein